MLRKREVFGTFTLSWFVVERHFGHLQLSERELCITYIIQDNSLLCECFFAIIFYIYFFEECLFKNKQTNKNPFNLAGFFTNRRWESIKFTSILMYFLWAISVREEPIL